MILVTSTLSAGPGWSPAVLSEAAPARRRAAPTVSDRDRGASPAPPDAARPQRRGARALPPVFRLRLGAAAAGCRCARRRRA
eukprot:214320-Hanusia_phi.AAC.1